jgi:cytoskeletal protein CcmA (bactofilin family)
MGSLSNLYVSQSYQSLLHLGVDTSFFPVGATAPQGYLNVEDGLGYNAGFAISSSGDMFFSQSVIVNKNLSINQNLDVDGNFIVSGTFDIEGKVTVNDDVRINGNLQVSGSTKLTGSLEVSNNITASNAFITNDLNVGGTLFASKVVTLIESSSIIYSSGSNILGDETSDTQTLIGLVRMSGSSQLTGSMGITGNFIAGGSGTFGGTGSFIGDLTATGNISSSTISGIGNVTLYSQSVDSRLDFLEGPFSTSVDFRLDELETWSSSLQTTFVTEVELTQTASLLQNNINTKLNTSSFNAYTQSTDNRINVLSSFTGSYATTGGNQTINGTLLVSSSMVYSGSVRGQVFPITISSNTASIDCSRGNFFTLSLPAGTTRLEATNVLPGETLSLRIFNQTTSSVVTTGTSVKFPTGFTYVPTPISNSTDIITFLTFDNSSIFAVAANYFA